ncbi:hypothetical protein Ddye_028503 [Dipteronia dyeriana]|uniref:SWIM-type domain-containing protein n=1 Tax=Dipteronia dyeriana TaxID=168575 RepID=A0AAD9TDG7_9ROSI|nr:hypothetical protein Ddye_028503 [Dipteronia dyeriana]
MSPYEGNLSHSAWQSAGGGNIGLTSVDIGLTGGVGVEVGSGGDNFGPAGVDIAFNRAILQACDKPVITLMEMIKNYLMKRLVRKRAELEKLTHDIGPKVFKFVEKLKLESNICHPDYSGNYKYQVRGAGDEQYVVDIENKACACNKWQLIGIPCIHGISVLLSSIRDPSQFIDIKFKKENF